MAQTSGRGVSIVETGQNFFQFAEIRRLFIEIRWPFLVVINIRIQVAELVQVAKKRGARHPHSVGKSLGVASGFSFNKVVQAHESSDQFEGKVHIEAY